MMNKKISNNREKKVKVKFRKYKIYQLKNSKNKLKAIKFNNKKKKIKEFLLKVI